MSLLTERYADKIRGTITCFDRVVIGGTLPDVCHAAALGRTLRREGVRLFDFPKWAEPLRNAIRDHAAQIAADHGLEIEFVGMKNFRMADRIREIVAERGAHPGLVHVFSVMEGCLSFRPWHDKATGFTRLRPRRSQCIHYYFYFIDEDLGLCHLRIPTWAPFALQVYFNGHNWLANQLRRKGIGFRLVDNAFMGIDDFDEAQRLTNDFSCERLHRKLDRWARQYCPVLRKFSAGVHWTIRQVEYATDIVWKSREALAPLYDALLRTSIVAVKALDVATFLGRPLNPLFEGELGSDFHTRIEGTRVKHRMGPSSIKMYDKFGCVLRIETTSNDVRSFRHRRKVEHRDGTTSMKVAPMRKTIHSLGVVAELFGAANRRYLQFLSALDDPTAGIRDMERVARPVRRNDRNHRGLNFFHGDDLDLIIALVRGEHTITGLRNRDIKACLGKTSAQVSRMLNRLRLHGLIKKVGRTYKYYVTKLGLKVVATALRLRHEVLIPAMAAPQVQPVQANS